MKPSLKYFGTDDELREGDRVEYKSLILRRKRLGTIVYIPPKTALELNDEKKPPDDWLIKLDNGIYTGGMFHPEELQPGKRLRLISRDADYERTTSDQLEREEAEAEEARGLKEDLLGCGLLLAIAFAVIMLIAIMKYGLPW